jgi:hypothetical protein
MAEKGKKIGMIIGLVAVAGVVGYVATSYPPSSDETSGTIAPVERYRADQDGGTINGGGDASDRDVVDASGDANDNAADAENDSENDAENFALRDSENDSENDQEADSENDQEADQEADSEKDSVN